MTLLLDTHVLLWWWGEKVRLSAEVQRAIATSDIVMVSAASAWETTIKQALGTLRLPAPFAAMVLGSAFSELPVTFRHAERLAALPAHHRDPFDRMLIAQAQVERVALVTHDRHFAAYDVKVLWA